MREILYKLASRNNIGTIVRILKAISIEEEKEVKEILKENVEEVRERCLVKGENKNKYWNKHSFVII